MAKNQPNRLPAGRLRRGRVGWLALIATSVAAYGQEADEAPETEPAATEPAATENAAALGEGIEVPREEYLSRLEAQIVLVDLVRESRFEDALPVAQNMVDLTAAEFGRPSVEVATALSNLAVIQRNLEHYQDSNVSFQDAIEMFREVEGPFTESIIDPLISLGANYHATGDYPQALGIFQEARTVNRRAYGLLNEDQIDIVYHVAATLTSMRRYEEAHEQQQDALNIMERVHGVDTLEIVPYIHSYAEWLIGAFQFEAGRVQYVRAMDIIRARESVDSPSLIVPLSEIGNSYRAQKLAEGRGISSLKRALEIAEMGTDTLALARVLRDIGDWYTAFSRVGASGQEYIRAWQLLGDVEEGETIRQEWFAEPGYVLREYPSSRGLADPGDPGVVPGHVLVAFDVDKDGHPLNAVVIEAEPPDFKDDTMLRAIRRSRFRPRVVDGELVYATGIVRNFSFHYDPDQ
jgi:tetratricopeptide (TPR) repeat protein